MYGLVYKEQLNCLGFFRMKEKKMWRETTGIFKTIKPQDNPGWRRPQISNTKLLLKAGSL